MASQLSKSAPGEAGSLERIDSDVDRPLCVALLSANSGYTSKSTLSGRWMELSTVPDLKVSG